MKTTRILAILVLALGLTVKVANADFTFGTPTNLGPTVNSSSGDSAPNISADGLTLYFKSDRPGGYGASDLWQVSIEPVVDFNGDGIVDAADMCIMVDHWGEDYSLCDIGPMPWGDGIVDVQDLIVLAEHLFNPDLLGKSGIDGVFEKVITDIIADKPQWLPSGQNLHYQTLNNLNIKEVTNPCHITYLHGRYDEARHFQLRTYASQQTVVAETPHRHRYRTPMPQGQVANITLSESRPNLQRKRQ